MNHSRVSAVRVVVMAILAVLLGADAAWAFFTALALPSRFVLRNVASLSMPPERPP